MRKYLFIIALSTSSAFGASITDRIASLETKVFGRPQTNDVARPKIGPSSVTKQLLPEEQRVKDRDALRVAHIAEIRKTNPKLADRLEKAAADRAERAKAVTIGK